MAELNYRLAGENVARPAKQVPMIVRSHAFAAGILLALSLLSCASRCHAQQGQPSQPRGSTIPTLEALPHNALPPGRFLGWCGLNGKILLTIGRGTEIYDGGVKASPLTFPSRSTLECDNDGRKLAFIDEEAGSASEVDIAGGSVTRTLATFDKQLTQEISFSPDLKNVASRQPLTLGPTAVNLNVIALSGPGRRAVGRVRWSRDSSEFFGISAPEGKAKQSIVEIFNLQHQRIGSGALPAGFLFTDGWFANSQELYLYLTPSRNEFGAGSIFRCRIAGWKCVQFAQNVLDVSVGGDGLVAMVRAVGKYSNDGELITYPPRYVAEIRNDVSQVVARQMFKSTDRNAFALAVAPSGMKAILTWSENKAWRCPPEKRESELCRNGIMIDLVGEA